MKIDFFISSLGGGGAERNILIIADTLSERGHDVNLVTLTARDAYSGVFGGKVNRVCLNGRFGLSTFKFLVYTLRRKPDVVISTLVQSNVIALLSHVLFKIPKKLIVRHNAFIDENIKQNSSSKNVRSELKRLNYYLLSKLLRFADMNIAISEQIKKNLIPYIKEKRKIAVIHNPIVFEEMYKMAEEEIVKKKILETKSKIILSVGRFDPQKGHSFLLTAFSILPKTTDAILVLLGEGQEKDELISQCEALGISEKVFFVGFVKNPYPYYKLCDLFVLPSIVEPFGNALVEAMAFDKPVVATMSGGPVEILDKGKWGELVPFGDTNTMARAIIASLEEKRTSTRTRANDFTVKQVVSKYESMINS